MTTTPSTLGIAAAVTRTVTVDGSAPAHADARGEAGARAAERVTSARFVEPGARTAAIAALASGGALVVTIDVRASGGRLAEAIEDAIEVELAACRAAAPGARVGEGPYAALGDQLFRARRAGATTIALAFGPLHRDETTRALDPRDVAALRALAREAEERAIPLLFDATDATIDAIVTPLPPRVAPTATPTANATTPPTTPPTAAPTATPTATPTAPAIPEAPPRPPPRHSAGASVASADDSWRHWALQLSSARGPQPLAAFERLFTQSYMPLTNAIAAGLDDPRARAAQDEFRRGFEKAYPEAATTFGATGKRPKMVLDAVDLAQRSARLHGARTAQLLLVDGMRWDIGQHVRARLGVLLGSRAVQTDEIVLWSALPTTTARQLVMLARGPDSLRSAPEREPEIESLRGRTAEIVRRMRIGSRDLYKVDVVEARVREAAAGAFDALPAIGEAAARVVAHHVESLPPRTLVLVFGDHGFCLDRTGVARHGGASPEEVLVPAWGILVGDVH